MADQTYVRRVRAAIREHGFFIQGVGPSHPTDPTYWYTIGLQRLRVPRPEVIVFGLEQHCASEALWSVYERVRVDGPLHAGDQLTGLFPLDPRQPVRIGRVRPEWAETYAGMVEPVLRRRAHDVPMLQLVLTDADGRWPEDPDVDPTLAGDQPLLAKAPCWQAAIVHTSTEDLFFDELPGSALVAVPVHSPSLPKGRYELLRAEAAGAEAARLLDVPWVADHVASGDLVQTIPPSGAPGLPEGTTVMHTLLERVPCQTRAFSLPPADTPAEALAELTAVLWDLVDAGAIRAATTRSTLHVNTAAPEHFDEAVRVFVRDGLLAPMGLQSEVDQFLPPEQDCSACQALRMQ